MNTIKPQVHSGCRLNSGDTDASPQMVGDRVRAMHVAAVFCLATKQRDVLQLSGRLAGDVKESPNGNPTRDLQMAADRIRPHTLCGPVVSSLFSFAARC